MQLTKYDWQDCGIALDKLIEKYGRHIVLEILAARFSKNDKVVFLDAMAKDYVEFSVIAQEQSDT